MKFFWQMLVLVEGIALVVMFRHWWNLNAKKVKMEIISYQERLRYRKVVDLCSVFIIGGIISALIVVINL